MAPFEIDLNIYPNEHALLAALQRGEADACTCLVKQFAHQLYRAVFQVVQDADEAETVVQSAFIKACDHIDTFAARSQLGTWLHRIARNEALMQRRKERGQRVSLEPADAPEEDSTPRVTLAASVGDPLIAALGSELRAELERTIAALPEGNRQVFLLRDIFGLSIKETAQQLGLNESAVKVRLHRARQQLREQLLPYLAQYRH